MTEEAAKSVSDLIAVMAALRTPGTGCPWDLAQSFRSIAPYTIEEAYEVADAIEKESMSALKEELGDLLLQVVYHARMAEEQGAFAFADVADTITHKMLRRHPHVFGTAAERAAGAAPGFWERIKAEEAAQKAAAAGSGSGPGHAHARSLLDDVPAGLAALTRAVKLQDKAARVGFDWPSLDPVFAKLNEEMAELQEAITRAEAEGAAEERVEANAEITEEFGDLLFVIANVARHLKIDPEGALRAANTKFRRRFGRIEQLLTEHGRTPAQSDLAEMDRLWDQAKAEERGRP